ncbi:MAG TPA: hypothetical protein PK006_09275 [Saprospiraceae bacterium]|nr:hypothetical protein [Saprospiraceae bacterium]
MELSKSVIGGIIFWALFFICSVQLSGQSGWELLKDVSYKKVADENLGFEVNVPIFGKEIKNLENKEISLRGFIIPTDGYKGQSEFVFSAFPYKNCFFCGGAGPETVMAVKARKPIIYTSEKIEIKGKLRLNITDLNQLMFQLVDAEKL